MPEKMTDQLPFNEGQASGPPVLEGSAQGSGGRSCLFWGCVGLVLVTLLVVVGTGGCIYVVSQQFENLFEDEGTVFEEIPASAERVDDIRARLENFRQGPPGKDTELVLDADELNILLLAHPDPDFSELAKFQRLSITDSSLAAEVSLPMDWGIARVGEVIKEFETKGEPVPGELEALRFLVGRFEGRYFNAALELSLEVRQEAVRAEIRRVVVAGGVEFGPKELRNGDRRSLDDLEDKVGRAFEKIFFGDASGRKQIVFSGEKLTLRRAP